MRWLWRVLPVVLLSAWVCGCGPRQPFLTENRLQRGLVIVLTGIEGRSPLNEEICRGLEEGGVNMGIELRDWTGTVPVLLNLQTTNRNRRKATEIADAIVRYKIAYPYRPVFLIGQSGGGAMAVWAAEALPPEQPIDGIILLAAALSPQYPLDGALQRVRRGIVSFYSPRDWMFLGVGTFIYGTMDRAHTSSAGRLGFEMPRRQRRARLYEQKLFQIAWQEEMARVGYHGGHLGSGARDFVAKYVAPFVRARRWSADWIAETLNLGVTTPGEIVPAPGESAEPAIEPGEPSTQPAGPTTGRSSVPSTQSAEPTGPPASAPAGSSRVHEPARGWVLS